MNLLDRPEFVATRRRVGEGYSANEYSFSFHEAGRSNPYREIGETLLKPSLHPPPHLLADPMGAEAHGDDHAGDRQRQRPADDGPENVGEGLHARTNARRKPTGKRGAAPAGARGRQRDPTRGAGE